MLIIFFVFGCICRLLEDRLGIQMLLYIAIGVFVVAWIAQFIGHKIEGRRLPAELPCPPPEPSANLNAKLPKLRIQVCRWLRG